MSDITKSANIGTGTFYNYYSSKEKLFMAIYIIENDSALDGFMVAVDMQGKASLIKRETS